MHIVKSKLYLMLLALGLFVNFSACKNDDEPELVLSVASFSPASGPIGTEVTITGTLFSTTATSNVVKFNGVEAEVKSATATQIVAIVPAGATNGPISVTTNNVTAQSASSFSLSNRPVQEVSGDITANVTWTNDKIYILKGFVYVKNNAILTIEPGTLIKGATKDQDPSGEQRGGALIITQGSKLMAVGTETSPIVFTSSKPIGQRSYGDWAGVVLIGKAPHNRPGATKPEGGIGGNEGLGTFNEPADNSGTLKYVRIEFPGIALSNQANSEINGLTLYGVGTGTTIEHVQVSYSGDDSFEWFGGSVNAKYLVAFRGFDDDWDTDWGFTGKVQYALSLRDPEFADQSGSNGFESDNFAGTGEPATGPNDGMPLTAPVFANVSNFVFSGAPSAAPSPKGSGPYQSAMHLRRNTAISIYNSLFAGYPEGLRLDGTRTGTWANATSGKLDLKGVVLANTTTPVLGKSEITNAEATTYFNEAARKNVITDIATLVLNSANFNLKTPGFLPQSGSPLLQGAVWEGKGADAFFTKETFRGAFGTTDWTAKWTNWDPQNTDYDK